MADLSLRIFLADHHQRRVNKIWQILTNHFEIEPYLKAVSSFQELVSDLESIRKENRPNLVIFANDLPYVENSPTPKKKSINRLPQPQLIDLLNRNSGTRFFLIYFSDTPSPLSIEQSNLKYMKLTKRPRGALKIDDFEPLFQHIEDLVGQPRVKDLPALKWNKNDWILRRQIRTLSENRSQDEGETLLKWVIYKSVDCRKAIIKSLGQGKSGAYVFRVLYDANGKEKQFILKLSDDGDIKKGNLRKLDREVNGYLQARESLVLEDLLKHVPDLIPPRKSEFQTSEIKKYIVRSKTWYAISYQFLGGAGFGNVIDLATVLTESPEQILKKMEGTSLRKNLEEVGYNRESLAGEIRLKIVDSILDWLRRRWYENKNGGTNNSRLRLWNFDGSKIDKFEAKPPYWLSPKTKEEILQFLGGRQGDLGSRMFPGDWKIVSQSVREFIEDAKDKKLPGRLVRFVRPQTVVLTPVHGDLNANNILFWLEELHPFLIDFPFFQLRAHTMQDLAQLECEVKFSLMDRQQGVKAAELRAYDDTYSQTDAWKVLDDVLRDENESRLNQVPWPEGRYVQNIKFSGEVIKRIRQCAMDVRQFHARGADPEEFWTEYFAALLYHTLRNITYETHSVFKRLLAVYSAGKLIEALR